MEEGRYVMKLSKSGYLYYMSLTKEFSIILISKLILFPSTQLADICIYMLVLELIC